MSEPGPSQPPTSIECRQIAELLGDYIEGTLPREARELIDWHIEACAPCVAFVNTYRGTINGARTLREAEIPPELKQRLLKVLRARKP
ncbi:MAG: zf-HC2 domain-containing protein [Candidatus Rokubacteria bacterium]|nr:zf-HC2 domain-containing protein [Candidatus Rokubacteria bacterium]